MIDAVLRAAVLAALCALLAACAGDQDKPGARARNADGTAALPAPEGAPGRGVTGMPDAPGPGRVGPPDGTQQAVALDEFGNPLPAGEVPADAPLDGTPLEGTPLEGAGADAPVIQDSTAEPGVQDAVAVVRDYYAAINARDYGRAFALWADGGRASGQSPQQFADGFANTSGVSVEILAPGRIEGAAGSRLVEVPVALTATRADGSERRFVGAYTLRRSVVDGATPEQRGWRIASADLREVQP